MRTSKPAKTDLRLGETKRDWRHRKVSGDAQRRNVQAVTRRLALQAQVLLWRDGRAGYPKRPSGERQYESGAETDSAHDHAGEEAAGESHCRGQAAAQVGFSRGIEGARACQAPGPTDRSDTMRRVAHQGRETCGVQAEA